MPIADEVRILYGSEMGNAEYLAGDLAEALAEHGIRSTTAELDAQPVAGLGAAGVALILVSTYGEGEMPYGAEEFWERLDADDAPSCAGLHYAVLALGDSSYTYFCEAGVLIDARLAELGATRLAERVDCDSNYRAPAVAWIRERVTQLGESARGGEEAPAAVSAADAPRPADPIPRSASSGSADPSPWTRDHPFSARLTRAVRLSGAGSGKEVMHYEFDLAGSGIEPRPGDSIGVIPSNDPYAVDRFLEAARLPAWRPLAGRSLRFLAAERWELRFPSAALLDEIGIRAPRSPLGSLVVAEDRVAIDEWIRVHSVADALRELPEPVAATRLGELMGPIRYRAYSVASSALAHPGSVHLTVATQRPAGSWGMRSGVASGFLADRLAPGEEAGVFPLPNRSFRLPNDDATPILMIGPGVGVAPFRAFLQERELRGASGAAWLFFGDRHEATDFLYRDDWSGFRERGALTRIDTAFSRDGTEKVYVQTRMRERAAELVRWLVGGAHLYVCGDAHRMARDVEDTLRAILVEQLGARAGAELWRRLHEERRYLRDVY